jgi:parallel beta-helix repeat protein
LRQSIRISAAVTLQGAGGSTVLRRVKQAESKLSARAAPGGASIWVENATLFRAGDEIGIWDRESFGWNVGHAVVKGTKGNQVLLDRRLSRGYDPAKGGLVTTCFPAINANEASRIVIRDLVIDGRPADKPQANSEVQLGFTFAAIILVRATNSRVEGCWVVGWPSDGISVQGGGGNAVVRCRVQDCRGNGLHPGGGLRDSTFTENVVRKNGGEGLYFCAGVRNVVVGHNVFAANKGNGIGALGDNGDKYNVVTTNVCEANGGSGIWLFGGDNNTVVNNICLNNSQTGPGQAGGIVLNQTTDTIVSGNRCLDDQTHKTQKHGILEFSSCRSNLIANNLCRGNAGSGLELAGQNTRQSGNLE